MIPGRGISKNPENTRQFLKKMKFFEKMKFEVDFLVVEADDRRIERCTKNICSEILFTNLLRQTNWSGGLI